jgi:hypothetical protein
MFDIAQVAAGGAIGIGGTLLGTTANYGLTIHRERRQFRLDTALELAGMERIVSNTSEAGQVELRAHTQRQDARLIECKISAPARSAFETISMACWADASAAKELGRTEIIDSGLVAVRRQLQVALRAELMRSGRRSQRAKALQVAVSAVIAAVPEPSQESMDSELFL